MMDKLCNYCNKTFSSDYGRVFSNHVRWCVNNPANNRATRICVFCGKSKTKIALNHELGCAKNPANNIPCVNCGTCVKDSRAKFCSRSCSASYSNKHTTYKSRGPVKGFIFPTVYKTCIKCNDSFGITSCSRRVECEKCFKRTITLTCVMCGIQFTCKPRAKRKTCGDSCYSRLLVTNSTNNPNCGGQTNYKKYVYKGIHMDSSWEVDIATYMDSVGIVWERSRKHMFWWTDNNGRKRRYYPDFWVPSLGVYLDPKNKYLVSEDKLKLDRVMSENKITVYYGTLDFIKSKLTGIPFT